MADVIQKDTIGALYIVTAFDIDDLATPLDISDAGPTPLTTKVVRFGKPSGVTVNKTLSFVTDGTDGQMVYEFIAADLDEIGKWEHQIFLTFDDGSYYPGSVGIFEVLDNIEEP
jgi:hypothetical protein